jgi:hypothetical protein
MKGPGGSNLRMLRLQIAWLCLALLCISFLLCCNNTTNDAVTPSASVSDPTDAGLSSLTASPGSLSPVFASGTTAYTMSVANSVSSLAVSATANNSKATVNGAGAANLSVGSNTISVSVTAADGATKKTYTITVTRHTDSSLSALSLSSGTLSPSFASGTTSYTANAGTASSVTVSATASDPSATVGGTGSVSAFVGANKIQLLVTASDSSTTTYTITVTKIAALGDYVGTWKATSGTTTTTLAIVTGGGTTLTKSDSSTTPVSTQTQTGTTTVAATTGAATIAITAVSVTEPFTAVYSAGKGYVTFESATYKWYNGSSLTFPVGEFVNQDAVDSKPSTVTTALWFKTGSGGVFTYADRTKSYTGTWSGSSSPYSVTYAVDSAYASYSIAATMDGVANPDTITLSGNRVLTKQ